VGGVHASAAVQDSLIFTVFILSCAYPGLRHQRWSQRDPVVRGSKTACGHRSSPASKSENTSSRRSDVSAWRWKRKGSIISQLQCMRWILCWLSCQIQTRSRRCRYFSAKPAYKENWQKALLLLTYRLYKSPWRPPVSLTDCTRWPRPLHYYLQTVQDALTPPILPTDCTRRPWPLQYYLQVLQDALDASNVTYRLYKSALTSLELLAECTRRPDPSNITYRFYKTP